MGHISLQLQPQILLLLLRQRPSLQDPFNLFPNLFIRLLQMISLRIKHINIIIQTIILFFRLNKRSNNLFNILNTSSLFNLIKSIFNDLNIPNILIHKFLLLFISSYYLIQPQLEYSHWITKISCLCLILGL